MAEPLAQHAAGLADRLSQPARLLGWRTLRGASGHRYAFGILDTDGELPRAAGVYCLAKRTAHANGINCTELLRIGQTDDLGTMPVGGPMAKRPSFNAVCIYLEENEFRRRLILRDVTSEPGLGLSDRLAR
ncbi:hypothetical protein H0Z60_01040 [Ectothiorhodospiraceae bacterium WFHF3C12]|nr:hypothetical protein [Ectothiorhodospiraceae bacterium WFHF3C12]